MIRQVLYLVLYAVSYLRIHGNEFCGGLCCYVVLTVDESVLLVWQISTRSGALENEIPLQQCPLHRVCESGGGPSSKISQNKGVREVCGCE